MAKKKWSADVTKHSNALDLDKGVFKQGSSTRIARSLERSADKSTRKKSDSYRSAMSMLTFYINRAGKNLPESQKKVLERAKEILRQDHEKNGSRPAAGNASSRPAAKRSSHPAKPQTRSAPRRQRSSK
jgi:putative cell wall-binding protein